MNRSTPGLPVHHQFLKLAQTHVPRVSDAIQSSHLLSSLYPPAFNLSQHQGPFQWFGTSHQVAKVLELQLQYQHFQWILISFRIYWFGVLEVQGTHKSLIQPYSLKASILQCLAFYMVQHSHPHMTFGKIIALTIQTFVGKVISLLFNILCGFSHLFFQEASVF